MSNRIVQKEYVQIAVFLILVLAWGILTSPAAFADGTLISTSLDHTCSIRTDGSVACWGDDYFDQSSPPAGTFSQVFDIAVATAMSVEPMPVVKAPIAPPVQV